MAKYINNNNFLYNTILCLGKGKLNDEMKNYFYLISQNIINKKTIFYKSKEDIEDIQQSVYLKLHDGWKSFNPKKYDNPFAYYSEIAKRKMAEEFNFMNKLGKMISIDSFMESYSNNF